MNLENFFETFFIIFLILGIILSLAFNNFILHAIIILFFGIIVASLHKLKKAELNFPYVFLAVGFLLGYLISTKSGYRFWIIFIFFIGIIIGLASRKFVAKYIDAE